jgi:AcrR family transcriptional regulator
MNPLNFHESERHMGGKREKQKKERRVRIIAAATKFFNSKGYDATSLSDIAKDAGLAVGTVYNYYPSKAALLPELKQDAVGHLHERFDALTEDPPGDPREALGAVARVVLTQTLEWDLALGKHLLAASFTEPENVGSHTLFFELAAVETIRTLLEYYTKSGSLHIALPIETATEAIHAAITAQNNILLMGDAPDYQHMEFFLKQIDAQLELILYGWLLMVGRR